MQNIRNDNMKKSIEIIISNKILLLKKTFLTRKKLYDVSVSFFQMRNTSIAKGVDFNRRKKAVD